MPDINASIWTKYKNKGVLVYGLYSGEDPTQISAFKKQTGIDFPLLLDNNFTEADFAYPQGVGYPYPRDVVIGKDLTVRAIRNSFNATEMGSLIKALLAE